MFLLPRDSVPGSCQGLCPWTLLKGVTPLRIPFLRFGCAASLWLCAHGACYCGKQSGWHPKGWRGRSKSPRLASADAKPTSTSKGKARLTWPSPALCLFDSPVPPTHPRAQPQPKELNSIAKWESRRASCSRASPVGSCRRQSGKRCWNEDPSRVQIGRAHV